MSDIPPAPAGAEDPAVNIHSAAPSLEPESEPSEATGAPQDAETAKAIEEDIKRDHVPHIGATG